jgi:hypothetical protein
MFVGQQRGGWGCWGLGNQAGNTAGGESAAAGKLDEAGPAVGTAEKTGNRGVTALAERPGGDEHDLAINQDRRDIRIGSDGTTHRGPGVS